MPIVIKCPSCRTSLRVPSKVIRRGKDIHCPRCKAAVSPYAGIEYSAESAAPPAPTTRPATAPPPGPPAADAASGDQIVLFPADGSGGKPPRPAGPPKKPKKKSRPERRGNNPAALPMVHPRSDQSRSKKRAQQHTPLDADDVIDVLQLADLETAAAPSHAQYTGGDEAYDEDAEAGTAGWRESLAKSRMGIGLVYTASCLFLSALAVTLLAYLSYRVVAACGAPAAAVTAGQIIAALAGVVLAGSAGVAVVGQVFGCMSPTRSSAQLLGILSLGCSAGALLVGLTGAVLSLSSSGGLGFPLVLVAGGVGVAHAFLFLFFLRALALAIRARWVALSFRNLLIASGASLAAYAIFIGVVAAITGVSPAAGAAALVAPAAADAEQPAGGIGWPLAAGIGCAVALALFVWFERTLQELKTTLDSRLGLPKTYGLPVWVAILGACGGLFFVNLIFAFIMFMAGGRSEAPKPKEPEAAPAGGVPLYRVPLTVPWS